MNDMMNPYEKAFAKVLIREFREKEPPYGFLQKIRETTDEDVQKVIPGGTRRWLMKEVSRWKNKLLPKDGGIGYFKPTLQNLWLFCRVTGAKPDEILHG